MNGFSSCFIHLWIADLHWRHQNVKTWNNTYGIMWFHLLCRPTDLQPSQSGLRWVIVDGRSSDAALYPSTSRSNSPCIAWKYVWGHCPVKKTNDVHPLSENQMGWHVICLKWITNSVTSRAPSHFNTSSFVSHSGNHTCRKHPFTFSCCFHKDRGGFEPKVIWGAVKWWFSRQVNVISPLQQRRLSVFLSWGRSHYS